MGKTINFVALALLLAAAAFAQSISGSLTGSVVDSSDAVIAGAVVKVINEATGQERSSATETTGAFVFPGLVPGRYTIRVEAAGFKPLERKGNVVLTAERLTVGELRLEVGGVSETVSVTAEGVGVQTDTSSTSALLDSRQVEMQGLRGRDPISMLRLLPGVEQGRISDMLGGSFGTPVPRFMGKDNNTIFVDGVNGGDGGGGGNFSGAINADAIQEINVQMNSYSAQYGRGGGPQINIVSKSGGAQYHGSLYWFKRHEMFNANNFFNNRDGLPKPPARFWNQGATIGGPVPFAKWGGEQKIFFFYSFDYTGTKRENPIRRFTMPTALERQGDFSQSRANNGNLIQITDPLTGQPFPGNTIPASRRDPNGSAILNLFPLPNTSGTGFNYIVQFPTEHPRRQNLFKIDFRPTANDTISFKGSTWYVHQQGFESPGAQTADARWGQIDAVYDFTTDMATASYTKVITPQIVNELMAGIFYSTEQGPLSSDEALARLQKQNTGLAGLPQFAPGNNPLNIVPMAQFPGLQNNGFNQPRVHFDGRFPLNGFDTALTAQNNLTYSKNSHTFKMGVWWEKAAFRQARSGNFSGEFNFQQNANNPRSTGNAFANAFIGSFDSYVEGLGRVADNRVQNTVAWYVQDDWKIRRNFTLNIGLRMYRWGRNLQQGGEASQFTFERFDPRWGGNPPVLFTPTGTGANRRALNPVTGALLPANYIGTIVPGTGYSCTGQLSAENPCVFNGIVIQENGNYVDGGRGFIEPIPILFDPRFGFAWDPFGNGKTAIRGSWGTFHVATGGADYRKGGPAFQFDQRIVYGDIATMLTATPVTNPVNVEGTWKDRKQQVNYQYNFGIQQDIGRRTILDVAYVGYTTRHRELTWNYNMLPSGIRFRPENREPSGTPLPDNFLRPIIGFGDINLRGNGGTDRYDSLQVQLNRRFTGGVEIAANYTYQNGLQTGWFQQLQVVNKERMVDIQTHVFNFSYVVDLPRGSSLIPGAIGRAVFDNWQVSGVTTFANGKPTNVDLATTDNFDFSGGGETCGVVLTGSAILPRGERTVNRWFNTSVFKRPSGPGDLGNDCSNYKFRAPGINNWDVSLFKNFIVGEGKKFQLRWEMYNVFNHTQFETVNTTARFNPQGEQVNAAFGQVTGARQERRMQVGLRFSF